MAEALTSGFDVPLRVSDVTRYLKQMIDGDDVLGALSVRGELAEFSRASSGHLYFTLKDSGSQLAAVMFRREAARQADELVEVRRGVSVIAHGYLTLYEPRGTYQMYVERLIPQGEGALFQRVERLRVKLENEGLFAPDRKRPLPRFPRKIALVTSPGSQAYHDVLHRLRTQYPFVTVIEAGASVRGEGAADEMAMAIDICNRLTDAEAILLVRGGGAPEELAAFNDERLARAIFASRLPVVTGIGHETDQSIADWVADVRAATPSLAAAAVVPDVAALVEQTAQAHRHIRQVLDTRVRHERGRWLSSNAALLRASPAGRLQVQRRRADALNRGLRRALSSSLEAKRVRLNALNAQLRTLDPTAILGRGYALLTDPETGRVISAREEATPGRHLRARVADGEFAVQVER